MDISKMTTQELQTLLQESKALAFDLIRAKDEAQRNLDVIVNRINEMEKENNERLSTKSS